MSFRGRISDRTRRARIVRAAAIACAFLLLVAGAFAGIRAARAGAARELDRRITSVANSERAKLNTYFERAREINLLVARNPVFRQFDERPGTQAQKLRSGSPDLEAANEALAYLEHLYPGQIGEACFIDASGAENARIIRGRRATLHELTPDESGNPFFRPTFRLPPGHVYQAAPYVSADTGEWVISNSTVVPSAGGKARSIVHFEVTLESFRQRLPSSGPVVRVADAMGNIVFDSRHPVGGATVPRATHDPAVAALVAGRTTLAQVGDDRVAIVPIAHRAENANQWYVVASAPALAGFSLASVGRGGSILVLAAIPFLILALCGFRMSQKELRQAANTDPLSGIPNRALFEGRAVRAIEASRRDGHRAAVLLLDLDRFKEVNDTLGHRTGDAVLREAAARLAAAVRDEDTLARLGGDEFAVLIPRIDDATAAEGVARRLLESLRPAFVVDGVPLSIDGSVGVAVAPDHGESADDLIMRADIAMYEAKRGGRGVHVFVPELDTADPERLAMAGELRIAIDAGQLELDYQPKVDLASGGVSGVEALVRWEHPRRGRLAAGHFIGLAEDTGLIRQLTEGVIEDALSQCRSWRDSGIFLGVAVNLSARCIQDASIVERIGLALNRWQVPASQLTIELTETSLVRDTAGARAALEGLAELGVAISVDDYGTGYSSLAYLRELPLHEIKIDRIFTDKLWDGGVDAKIVRSTVDLGHALGLRVVAEGVETGEMAQKLSALGCDEAQGYFFGRPMSPERLEQWLEAHERSRGRVPARSA